MDPIRLKHGQFVVVADGERALFLRNDGDGAYPNLRVVREMHDDNPSTHEQGTDRPGRHSDGPSAHKSAFEETDWHRLGKERFADEISERLYKMAHRGDFDQLVIVAPPLVLGEMRKKMHKVVGERVIAEVPKTLTNHSVDAIEKMLLAA